MNFFSRFFKGSLNDQASTKKEKEEIEDVESTKPILDEKKISISGMKTDDAKVIAHFKNFSHSETLIKNLQEQKESDKPFSLENEEVVLLEMFQESLEKNFPNLVEIEKYSFNIGLSYFGIEQDVVKCSTGQDDFLFLSHSLAVPNLEYDEEVVRFFILHLRCGVPEKIFLAVDSNQNKEIKSIDLDGEVSSLCGLWTLDIYFVAKALKEKYLGLKMTEENEEDLKQVARCISRFGRSDSTFRSLLHDDILGNFHHIMGNGGFLGTFQKFIEQETGVDLQEEKGYFRFKSYEFFTHERYKRLSDDRGRLLILTPDVDKVYDDEEGGVLGNVKHIIIHFLNDRISKWFFVEERPYLLQSVLYRLMSDGTVIPCGTPSDSRWQSAFSLLDSNIRKAGSNIDHANDFYN